MFLAPIHIASMNNNYDVLNILLLQNDIDIMKKASVRFYIYSVNLSILEFLYFIFR